MSEDDNNDYGNYCELVECDYNVRLYNCVLQLLSISDAQWCQGAFMAGFFTLVQGTCWIMPKHTFWTDFQMRLNNWGIQTDCWHITDLNISYNIILTTKIYTKIYNRANFDDENLDS